MSGLRHGLSAGDQRHLYVTVEEPQLGFGEVILAAKRGRGGQPLDAISGEFGNDAAKAGLAGCQGAPKLGHADTQRRDTAVAGYDHAASPAIATPGAGFA